MSFSTCSAGALLGPDFCFIFAPCGYDEPEILPSESPSVCLKGADGEQCRWIASEQPGLSGSAAGPSFSNEQLRPFRGEHYEPIIHVRPCRTLYSAKPSRHGPDDPQPRQVRRHTGRLSAEYYAQRASVGLIVTQGTQPSDDGQGYL